MIRVGLTGGMGSGKSTLLKRFQKENWLALDSDAIVRELLSKDEAVIAAIRDHFGGAVWSEGGGLSRPELASRVFSDTVELEWLENLLHPQVRKIWMESMEQSTSEVGIVEIPLLFEKNLEKYFDLTVCIVTNLDIRLKRLSDSGISPESARPRMARQLPSDEKARRADFVILNDGSLSFLQEQANLLHDKLKRTLS